MKIAILSEKLKGKVENKNIRYVAVDKASCEFENKDIKLLDYIQNEKQLVDIYVAADVVVIPSLEDNSDELIGTLKDNGFNENSDYIVMSRLEKK